MTQEGNLRQLLLRDLCARSPYMPKVHADDGLSPDGKGSDYTLLGVNANKRIVLLGLDFGGIYATHKEYLENIKPYLRPMSNMTEEELEDLNTLAYHNISVQDNALCGYICGNEIEDICDWLNAHHFDYRGIYDEKDRKWKSMIEMGLALPAPNGMYN